MKKFMSVLLTAALLFSCFGCGKGSTEGLTKVTLNEVAHSIFYAPMYVAIENDYFALVLESENPNEYHFTKVKLDIGLQTEEFVEVLNAASLKNKKIVVDGTYMLLNEGGEGGHSH